LVSRIDLTDVYERTDLQCPCTRRFEPLGPVALDEADDADARAEALLGMRSLTQDDLNERRCALPDLGRASLPRT
jgi:hypothetical protein